MLDERMAVMVRFRDPEGREVFVLAHQVAAVAPLGWKPDGPSAFGAGGEFSSVWLHGNQWPLAVHGSPDEVRNHLGLQASALPSWEATAPTAEQAEAAAAVEDDFDGECPF